MMQLGTGQSDTKFELRNRMQTLEPKRKGGAGKSPERSMAPAGLSTNQIRKFLGLTQIEESLEAAEELRQHLEQLVTYGQVVQLRVHCVPISVSVFAERITICVSVMCSSVCGAQWRSVNGIK